LPTEDRFLKTKEIASRLQVSTDWVRRHFRDRAGILRLGGGHMRIPESVVAAYLVERGMKEQEDSVRYKREHESETEIAR
jgi:predicted DNA-binding transcriptional regulator AlpA